MINNSNRLLHSRTAMRLRFELALIVVLLGFIAAAKMNFRPSSADDFVPMAPRPQETIEIEEILRTVQLPRPLLPMAAPVGVFEEVPDDTPLEETVLNLDAGLDVSPGPVDSTQSVRAALPPPPPPPRPATPEPEDEAEIFVVVEEMPEIEGGLARLYSLLRYPDLARRAGAEGRVVVEVVIEKNGQPADPRIVRSANPMLDEAAVEAVMKLTFKPGKQRGKAVRVRYNIPIRFELNREQKK